MLTPRWPYSDALLAEYHHLFTAWAMGSPKPRDLPTRDDFEAKLASASLVREQQNGYDLYRMGGSGRTHPRLQFLVHRATGEIARMLPESAHRPYSGPRKPDR